jgi:outer membrane protein assembly factor BamD (BamD/ComL family)
MFYRNLIYIVLLLAIAAPLAGCSDSAVDIYQAARLEERQNNPEHAAELYMELINKYPDCSYARDARERLDQMRRDEKQP